MFRDDPFGIFICTIVATLGVASILGIAGALPLTKALPPRRPIYEGKEG